MGPPRAATWRLRVDPPLPGPLNMARDHALALGLAPGAGALRFYRWGRPTLSLGRNEPAGRWDRRRLEDAGIDVVRRPTGGRAVLHYRELTYAVAVHAGGPGSMRTLYRAVNQALVEAWRGLGVPAASAPRPPWGSPGPDAGPCFALPAEGEVTVAGRKLVGSAQVRLDGRLLQHGSILLEDDQARLEALAGGSLGDGGATSLSAWLDPVPTAEALVPVLAEAFERSLGGDWHTDGPGPTLEGELEARLEARYRSPDWTWRR